jgi:hypothetical protein
MSNPTEGLLFYFDCLTLQQNPLHINKTENIYEAKNFGLNFAVWKIKSRFNAAFP